MTWENIQAQTLKNQITKLHIQYNERVCVHACLYM